MMTADGQTYYRPAEADALGMIDRLLWREALDEKKLESPELAGYLEAWEAFIDDTGFAPELIEAIVGVETGPRPYAGTIDRLGILNGRRIIIDIKSGGPAPWHVVQQEAYSIAEGGAPDTACLYLKETGRYSLKTYNIGDRLSARARWENALARAYRGAS